MVTFAVAATRGVESIDTRNGFRVVDWCGRDRFITSHDSDSSTRNFNTNRNLEQWSSTPLEVLEGLDVGLGLEVEQVAGAALGVDVAWDLRIVLDFLAQAGDVIVHGAGGGKNLVAPDVVQQLLAR